MTFPEVSIITSTYNRSAVLRRAIESVRAQRDFDNWEMCVVGDRIARRQRSCCGIRDPRLLL